MRWCLDELHSQGVCIVLVDVVEYDTIQDDMSMVTIFVEFRACSRDRGKLAGVEKKQHITYWKESTY